MVAYVKSEDKLITEIHGLINGKLSYGDEVPHPWNTLPGVGYYVVEGTSRWTGISDGHYQTAITKPQYPKIPDTRNDVYFRFHRGSLFDSLATAVKVSSVDDLTGIILQQDGDFLKPGDELSIKKYGYGKDERIGWDTYLVTWNKSVIGSLSGELK